ncbi:collagen-binding domain-containing protein [Timonella senegalensis]|uniref:collagen-binding domain-containing protein n=1 Tax=Timonella senegalensis TaxID=1465825 RepID=UPI002FDDCDF1
MSAALLGAAIALPTAATAASPEVTSINPVQSLAGDFAVLSYGDLILGNAEIEGAAATLGNLTFRRGYPVIHDSGLTPNAYALPVIDGDPTRLFVGGKFNVEGSKGVSELSSRGMIRDDQAGLAKFATLDNLAVGDRGNGGIWLSAAGTTSGTEPALHIPEAIKQSKDSLLLESPAASYFAKDLAAAQQISTDLAATLLAEFGGSADDPEALAVEVALTAGSHGGARNLGLVSGKTNVLNFDEADANFEIVLPEAQPSADTVLVINVEVKNRQTVRLPRFAAANNTNNANPNTVAPFVVYNVTMADNATGTIVGDKISGSILAPRGHLVLSANSPIEGQIIANDLSTAGGEIHYYSFFGKVPSTPKEPTVDPTEPTVDPTEPTVDPPEPEGETNPESGEQEEESLAQTGVNPALWIGASAALIAAGGALVRVRARRS